MTYKIIDFSFVVCYGGINHLLFTYMFSAVNVYQVVLGVSHQYDLGLQLSEHVLLWQSLVH